MPKTLLFPESPESPKYLLRLALTNGFQSTSKLLLTSVLGSWVIALLSYVIQSHIHNFWLMTIFNLLVVIALILTFIVGVIQCNQLYQNKTMSEKQALQAMSHKIIGVVVSVAIMFISLWLLTLFSGTVLQWVFKPGSLPLGIIRILLGCVYVFFLSATFLIIPMQVMSNKSIGTLFSELLHISMTHWLRCFLCLFAWLITVDLLSGGLALLILPILQEMPYALFIIKSISAVIVVPVLVSYTTLLTHDLLLRIKEAHQAVSD